MHNATQKAAGIERFYLLDIARGLASLSVVIWHFQHFYYPPGQFKTGEDFARAQQPLYDVLWPLYEHGLLAVQFFFVLSGFIFRWLYAERIANGQESARSFFVLRFSRLYPLHFLTLLLVAAMQVVSQYSLGHYIVYPVNDLKHFLFNGLLIQHWGVQSWFSFNAPSWSISVEVFAYIVFFCVMKLGATRIWHSVAMMLLALFCYSINAALAEVVLFFFAGCISYSVFQFLLQKNTAIAIALCLLLLGGVAAVAAGNNTGINAAVNLTTTIQISFPLTVLLLALLQQRFKAAGKHFALIGDLTYSTYLLHFPLQLAIMLLLQSGLMTLPMDTAFFSVFFLLLLLLSYACFHYFEKPAQRFIRQRFSG